MNEPERQRWWSAALSYLGRPLKWRAQDKIAGVAFLATAGVTIGALIWALVGSAEPTTAPLSGQGFTITGAVSTDITWDKDFPPNCSVFTTANDPAPSFDFDATVRGGATRLIAYICPFGGPASYDAAVAHANTWNQTGVTVFTLANERWLATGGTFTVDTSNDESAAGSVDADLAPAGPDAKGPIHVSGSWTCRHSGK